MYPSHVSPIPTNTVIDDNDDKQPTRLCAGDVYPKKDSPKGNKAKKG